MKKKGIALITVLLLSLSCFLVACSNKVYHFKVTFYSDTQGTEIWRVVEANSNEDINVPEDPQNDDSELVFGGWFTDKAGTKAFDPAGYRAQRSDFSVYPKWEKKPSEGIEYTPLDNDTYQVAGMGTFTGSSIIIPETYDGKPVASVAKGAFSGQTSITKVRLPNSIKFIGSEAFKGCTGLKSFVLPSAENLSIIGENAFSGCEYVVFYTSTSADSDKIFNGWGNWNPLDRPVYFGTDMIYEGTNFEYIVKAEDNGLSSSDGANNSFDFYDVFITRYFGDEDFTVPSKYFTNEKDLEIGDMSMLHIGNGAFDGVTAKITLPTAGINTIDEGAFSGYRGSAIDIPSNIAEIQANAFKDTEAAINFNGSAITTIVSYAFSGYNGEVINLPESVETIEKYAFTECTAEIKFAENNKVTTLDVYSLADYKGETFEVPAQVGAIKNRAFSGATANITFASGSKITELTKNVFNGYDGESITISDSVKTIAENAFFNCQNLKELTIPSTVTEIKDAAIYGNPSLTKIEVDGNNSAYSSDDGVLLGNNGKTLIAYPAGNAQTEYKLPETVEVIAPYAFFGSTNLENVTLSDNLSTISKNAFENCSGMRYIIIDPSVVKTVGENAFAGCGSMVIAIKGNQKPSGWDGNYNPDGCVEELNAASINLDEPTGFEYIVIDDKATIISYKGTQSELDIPETLGEMTVVAIGEEVFKDNREIKTVTLPESVKTIGKSAFENSTLETVTGEGVETIGNSAFRGTKLNSATFEKVKKIGEYAFSGTEIISFTAPALTDLGAYAFYESKLQSIDAVSITSIEKYVFANTALAEYNLPVAVTEIGDNAFENTKLTELIIPNTVTRIGSNILKGCAEFEKLTIGFVGSSIDDLQGVSYLFGDAKFEFELILTGEFKDKALNAKFSSSNITKLTLPATITELSAGALTTCEKLTEINGNLTKIGNNALQGCKMLEKINLENVTSIGNFAFASCEMLDNINIPKVESLGRAAFQNCSSLASITVPTTVKELGANMFNGCESLATVNILGDISAIGASAFNGCSSLETLSFNGVTSVGANAFTGCSAVVTIAGTIAEIAGNAFSGYLGETVVLPESVETIGASAFAESENLTSVTCANVKTIGEKAFENCVNLTSFDFGKVTELGEESFHNCSSLTSVVLQGVTKLPKSVFQDCVALGELTLGNVETIDSFSLANCISLYSLDVSKVKNIYSSAFQNCVNLKRLDLNLEKVDMVSEEAFEGCSKLVVYVDKSANEVNAKWERNWNADIKVVYNNDLGEIFVDEKSGNMAVYQSDGDNYTLISFVGSGSVSIPESVNGRSVTAIGESAFRELNSLTSVTLASSITSVGAYAFYNCTALTEVTATGVTSLGSYAFAGCELLKNVSFANLTSISDYAFSGCVGFVSLSLNVAAKDSDTPFVVGRYAFEDVTAELSLNGTDINLGAYAMAGYKGGTFDLGNVKSIGAYAFSGSTATVAFGQYDGDSVPDYAFAGYEGTSITLSGNITTIGNHAFEDCVNLIALNIPVSVVDIGEYAFNNVKGEIEFNESTTIEELGKKSFFGYKGTSFTIPESVKTIGESAFEDASAIITLEIPTGVTQIGAKAFKRASSLKGITFKGNVQAIGAEAFANCIELIGIELKGSFEAIEERLFYGCAKLESVTIPTSVTAIKFGAFYNCYALDNVTLPTDLTEIGDKVFYMCKALSQINIPANVELIGEEVFHGCTALTAITVEDSSEHYKAENGVLFDKNETLLICYPAGKADKDYVINDTVTKIAAYAFADNTSLQTVFIPETVKTIGDSAFYGCVNLTIRCQAPESADHSQFAENWYYCPSHSNGTDHCRLIWGFKKENL